jgi:hypothetical protein
MVEGGMSPSAARMADVLEALLSSRLEPEASAWTARALRDAGDPGSSPSAFLADLAGAGRRLGRAAVTVETAGEWGLDEVGRGALLLRRFAAVGQAERVALASEVYYRGEVRERQALLRILAYVPEPAAFLEIAQEACRTSIETVFRAIACDNPYPAAHFADLAFNQMVLKAVFVGAPVARVVGLEHRATPELARMATDYAAERTAAHRVVPADVDLILASATRNG